MIKKLKFNNISFNIVGNITLKEKLSQISLSNVTIDFEGYTSEDRPSKYQQIELLDENDLTVGYAYLNKIMMPKFKTFLEPMNLKLVLFSPQIWVAKRTYTNLFTSEQVKDIVEDVLKPLTDDGYTIAFNDISTTRITIKFINKTIEKILSELSIAFAFSWFVDQNKNIYLKDNLKALEDDDFVELNCDSKNFMKQLEPIINSYDYANVINIKNTLLLVDKRHILTNYQDLNFPSTNGETLYQLPLPIWFSIESAEKQTYPPFFSYYDGNNTFKNVGITYNDVTKEFVFPSEIGIDQVDTGKDIYIVFDPNNAELITQIKLDSSIVRIPDMSCGAVLEPFRYQFIDLDEINKTSLLSTTLGYVEKTIDAKNKYYEFDDLFEIARGDLTKANNSTSEVKMDFQCSVNDIAEFETFLSQFEILTPVRAKFDQVFVDGTYLVTEKNVIYSTNKITASLVVKNLNLSQTFLDIHRKEEIQEQSSQAIGQGLSLYVKDEAIIENPEIYVNGVKVNG